MIHISSCWMYAISKFGYPPSLEDTFQALKNMRDFGLHYLEMECLLHENTQIIYQNRHEIKKRADDLGAKFVNISAVLPDMFSENPKISMQGMDDFKKAIEVADTCEAGSLMVDSFPPPLPFKGTQPYGNSVEFEQLFSVQVLPEFCFNTYYERLVKTYRQCAEFASKSHKQLCVEPRVGECIHTTDSFLRLYEHVQHANLGIVLDTAHLYAAKEMLPFSVEKLGKKITCVHLADNDSRTNAHNEVGTGTIDWEELFTALKKHQFDGYIAIDVANVPDLDKAYARSIDYLQGVLNKLDISYDI